jgi:hypothetical protein
MRKHLLSRARAIISATGMALMCLVIAGSTSGMAQIIYNSIPNPLPPNDFSQPFQAQQTAEFGDLIQFGPGGRSLGPITLIMSNFAKKSTWAGTGTTWSHPLTLTLYNRSRGR